MTKPFKPWNPVDQIRLLWWLFATPGAFRAYQAEANEDEIHGALAWLVSTLIWLPLAIPVLGYTIGLGPPWWLGQPAAGWAVLGGIALMWFFMGRWGTTRRPGAMIIFVGYFAASIVTLSGVILVWLDESLTRVPFALVTVIAVLCYSVAMGLKLQVISGTPGYTPARYVSQIAGFVGLGVAVRLIGDVPVWVFLLLPILTTVLTRHFSGLVEQIVARSLETNGVSPGGRQLLFWLGLGNGALVWLYLLGGWALFVI